MDLFDELDHNFQDQEIPQETLDDVIPEVPASEGHPPEALLDPGDYNQINQEHTLQNKKQTLKY